MGGRPSSVHSSKAAGRSSSVHSSKAAGRPSRAHKHKPAQGCCCGTQAQACSVYSPGTLTRSIRRLTARAWCSRCSWLLNWPMQ